jgi:DNA polymerase
VGQTKLIEEESDQSCKRCSLHKTRISIVWQRGTAYKDVDVLFIGEAPGKDEDLRGEPFVGRAGQILDKWIEDIGLTNYNIINIVKCRPPGNRKPRPDEIRSCLPYLIKQIQQFDPKIIVALGATPCSVLINRKEVVSNIGKIFKTRYGNVIVFPHPAYVLRGVDVYIPITELKEILRTIRPISKQNQIY